MSKPPARQYHSRDIIALDDAGNYYTRHVHAMTAECLHGKSEIAAELAWRDLQIHRLKAEQFELEKTLYATLRRLTLMQQCHRDLHGTSTNLVNITRQSPGNQESLQQAIADLKLSVIRTGIDLPESPEG